MHESPFYADSNVLFTKPSGEYKPETYKSVLLRNIDEKNLSKILLI